MYTWEKVKCWFNKNKKYIQIGGTVAVIFAGAVAAYVLCNNKKISFDDWIKKASNQDLEQAHEVLRLDFCKTGVRSLEMEKISQELGSRGAKEWFAKHPPTPNFRWTDANRWEK